MSRKGEGWTYLGTALVLTFRLNHGEWRLLPVRLFQTDFLGADESLGLLFFMGRKLHWKYTEKQRITLTSQSTIAMEKKKILFHYQQQCLLHNKLFGIFWKNERACISTYIIFHVSLIPSGSVIHYAVSHMKFFYRNQQI